MALINITQKGDFSKTTRFLTKVRSMKYHAILDKYGKLGVNALRNATPKDTGKTADSWDYTINVNDDSATVYWTNSNQNKGRYIAVLIQYGHGMPNGGYVKGYDYINPAMRPIFDQIANDAWLEVTSE